MNIYLRITLVCAILVYFICIIWLLKKRKLELKYTLLWLFGGLAMALVVAFPQSFMFLMSKLGIVDAINGVFAAVCFVILIILMSITAIVSKLNRTIRSLTQRCAMYEKRIRELENKTK